MKDAKVTDPAAQPDEAGSVSARRSPSPTRRTSERVVTLVGEDEADAGAGRISWNSPIARAMRGAAVGDVRRVTLPVGEREHEMVAISYPESR